MSRMDISEIIKKVESTLKFDDDYSSDLMRLNDKVYRITTDFIGSEIGKDNHELGDIELLINGETGEVEFVPTITLFNEEQNITSEEFLIWAKAKSIGFKYTVRNGKIIAMGIHHVNNLKKREFDSVQYFENDYNHRIEFTLKNSYLNFTYCIRKNDGSRSLSAAHGESSGHSIDIKTNTIEDWDMLQKSLEEHPKVRLFLVTG